MKVEVELGEEKISFHGRMLDKKHIKTEKCTWVTLQNLVSWIKEGNGEREIGILIKTMIHKLNH